MNGEGEQHNITKHFNDLLNLFRSLAQFLYLILYISVNKQHSQYVSRVVDLNYSDGEWYWILIIWYKYYKQ